MRSRFFGNKIKSIVLVAFSAFLILPSLFSLFTHVTPAFADVLATTYTVAVYDSSGSNLIASVDVAGSTLFAHELNQDTQLSFSIASTGTGEGSGYADCVLSGSTNCQLLVRNGETVVATVTIPSSKLAMLNNMVNVTISPQGQPCTVGSNDNGCISTVVAASISPSLGSIYNDGVGPTTTISAATATQQYYDPTPPASDVTSTGDDVSCANAAKGLGWIVCTIADLGTGALNELYSALENLLVVNTNAVATTNADGSETGVHQVWNDFRIIANIIFVILMLIVILSQVTGVGIDNYGIKKILPRLIIAAIIVNLSFFVCQLFIDLSNITGAGIRTMLGSIDIKIDNLPATFGDAISGTAGAIGLLAIGFVGLVSAGGGAGAVAATGLGGALASGGAAALLGFVSVLLGAIVSILFMILLLGARLGVIVLGAVVSPVAIALSVLPNTKNVYDRWLKLMQGMLLLYPTCSLAIAGGQFASKVILSINNGNAGLLMVIVAVIVQIAPFFLVPTLVRNSFNAIGRLSGGIRGLSRRANTWGRTRLDNTTVMRRTRARVDANRAAGVDRDKLRDARHTIAALKRRQANGHSLTMAETQRLAEARQARHEAREKLRNATNWARDDYAAGKGAQARESAMRDVAQVEAARRVAQDPQFANADFQNALIQQATIAKQNERKDAQLYNMGAYTHALEVQQDEARRNKVADTMQWNDTGFVSGRSSEANLARQGNLERAKLFTNADYVTSRQNQQQAVISNEITKMYNDQYSRMDTGSLLSEFEHILKSPSGTQNHAEQFQAAFNTLAQTGQLDKARDLMATHSADFAALTNGTSAEQIAMRTKVAQTLGASGDFTLQEYAKHLGMHGDTSKSFADWADDTSTNKGDSLAASIAEKGIDRFDKDGLDFLSKHSGALAGASASNIAKVASTTTDTATIAKLTGVIDKLSNAQRLQVVQATSAAQFVNMNDAVRVALSKDALGTAHDSIWKAKVGAAIASTPQLKGKLTASELTRYT